MSVVRPLLATATWEAVVAAAGGRCTCTGACGSKHAKDGGRCGHGVDWAGRRLYAAPADPSIPARVAWKVAPADLTAWCGTCLDAAQRAARTTTSTAPAPEPGLFDLPTTTTTTTGKRAPRAA